MNYLLEEMVVCVNSVKDLALRPAKRNFPETLGVKFVQRVVRQEEIRRGKLHFDEERCIISWSGKSYLRIADLDDEKLEGMSLHDKHAEYMKHGFHPTYPLNEVTLHENA